MCSDHGGLHTALARAAAPSVCALEPGRSSWTAPLDALRLTPGGGSATAIARQLRDLIQQLTTTAHGQADSPDALVLADAGYDAPCLVHLLRDLPLQVLARMRWDRVLRRTARHGSLTPGAAAPAASSVFAQPGTWDAPDTENVTDTRIHGTAVAHSRGQLHPRLTDRSS